MPFWTYVLRSQSTGKLYIGHTSDLKRRLREHNDPNLNLSYLSTHPNFPYSMATS
ncbi:MAG TPA: hypothetical protein ENG51_21030 [Deltaproteobacteria bacterium]|nr:hypothetical protein [Deltaproteobacteria bacterium]